MTLPFCAVCVLFTEKPPDWASKKVDLFSLQKTERLGVRTLRVQPVLPLLTQLLTPVTMHFCQFYPEPRKPAASQTEYALGFVKTKKSWPKGQHSRQLCEALYIYRKIPSFKLVVIHTICMELFLLLGHWSKSKRVISSLFYQMSFLGTLFDS